MHGFTSASPRPRDAGWFGSRGLNLASTWISLAIVFVS